MLNNNKLIETKFVAVSACTWVHDYMPPLKTEEHFRRAIDRVDFINVAATLMDKNPDVELIVEVGERIHLKFTHAEMNEEEGRSLIGNTIDVIKDYLPTDAEELTEDLHTFLRCEEPLHMFLTIEEELILELKEEDREDIFELVKRIETKWEEEDI